MIASRRPVALVTGARRGIGAAIARALAAAGFDVAITDLVADDDARSALDGIAAAGGKALFIENDLAELGGHRLAIEEVAAKLGPIDCLVNNAGIGSPARGDLLEMRPAAFDEVLGVNLRGTFFFSQAVARHMLATASVHRRTIVIVSSVSAELASPERGEYCMSKAGLAMMARLLALRLAPRGVGVFEVRPGVIRTPMTAAVADGYDRRIGEGLVPMNRWGEPHDVADAVAALASGRFAFATGSVIHLDGGLAIPRL
ncbi:MAG TPA: 3-ketoacyl-ACP reductase [Burkholderiales bacterium]|nr:3-ketoacyl-ACP reductase [Burkholderiales bacterium]